VNFNKLVHETRGKCCHEPGRRGYCPKCSCKSPRLPDYESSMDACMELWEEGSLLGMRHYRGSESMDPYWRVWSHLTEARAETPQLAIIRAYLKSKGVELETGQ